MISPFSLAHKTGFTLAGTVFKLCKSLLTREPLQRRRSVRALPFSEKDTPATQERSQHNVYLQVM